MGIRNTFEEFFYLRSNLSNDDIIFAFRPGLKTGMHFRGLVWKQVWKMTFLFWYRVRIWITGRHAPPKNFQEYPPPGFHLDISVRVLTKQRRKKNGCNNDKHAIFALLLSLVALINNYLSPETVDWIYTVEYLLFY